MQIKKKLVGFVSVFLTLLIVLPLALGVFASAESVELYGTKNPYTSEIISELMDYPFYSVLRKEYEDKGYTAPKGDKAANTIIVPAGDITTKDGEKVTLTQAGEEGNVKNAFKWTYDNAVVTWTFEIKEAGLYQFSLDYYLEKDKGADPIRKLLIDGKKLYYEADNHMFYRYFVDENGAERVYNTDGDEMRPRAVEISKWRTSDISDYYGFESMPFAFYFEAGTHTVTMEYYSGDMFVGDFTVEPMEELKSYEQYKNELKANGLNSQPELLKPIMIDAEFPYERNGSAIRREADSDPECNPYQWDRKWLNTIGGGTWAKAQKAISWSFYVEEAGVYKIAVREFSSYNDNLSSYRKIEIDGEVPFAEFAEYEFPYSEKETWENHAFNIDGEEVYLYLEAGEHIITMTVVMGELSDVIQSIYYDLQLMTSFMNDIRVITGSSPDYNYDYGFYDGDDKREFKKRFQVMSDSMAWKYDSLVELSSTGKIPSMANSFKFLKTSFDEAIKYEYKIAKLYDTDFLSAQTSLSTYYGTLQSQSLLIDDFTVYNDSYELPERVSTFWQKFSASFKNFFLSFVKDYDSIKGVAGAKTPDTILNVWIARGIDWAELFKELADTTFTPETGIGVKLSIMPAGQLSAGATNALMLAIASGKNVPDLCIGADVNSPAEFAVRDATLRLDTYEDFDEVSQWFLDATLNPLTYNGGVYALPETMTFKAFFYRTDIFEELGITEIPESRQDIYNYVLPVLYRQNMTIGLGRDEVTFLLQYGASLYSEDYLYSGLGTAEAYLAMKEQTDLFTQYGIPVQQDAFNRFRTGETPCFIGAFENYVQLVAAAPELNGRWAIALIPGLETTDAEGNTVINRTHSGSITTSSYAMNATQYPDECWALLKWWMCEETQTEYGVSIEGIVGEVGRWNSANVASFDKMNWSVEDLAIIQETRNYVFEYPYVLGGYFTSRHITNAWTKVVMNNGNLRDALEEAVRDINRELKMKNEEYGFGYLYEKEGV